ncbi:hypothetical protein [Desulfosoma sp.]|uniref:hypothetical protein n=1 Tax=Desulfosoma sp. TaxID=2603217 RepID=UPI00404990DB
MVEPVVVTASKLPRTAGNVTQKVDVLESQNLSVIVTGHRNIADYLIYQPGVFSNVLSRNDANWGSVNGVLGHDCKTLTIRSGADNNELSYSSSCAERVFSRAIGIRNARRLLGF